MKMSLNEIAGACKEAVSGKIVNNNVYSVNVWSHFYMDNHNFDMGENGLTVFKDNIEDIIFENKGRAMMNDLKGNKICISMNADFVKIVVNNDNISVPGDKLIEAVDKSIFHQERNRKILATLLTERKFSIVEKGTSSPMFSDVDGWSENVAASDSCEDCSYYSMLLVGEPTLGGSWDLDEHGIYPHSKNDPDLADIKSRWVPLPVIADMLNLKEDFGFQGDNAGNPIYHKTTDVITSIMNAIA